jgi:hypothetical protein
MTTEVTTPSCEHDKLMTYAFVRLEGVVRDRLNDEMTKLQHGSCDAAAGANHSHINRAKAVGQLAICAAQLRDLARDMNATGKPLVADFHTVSVADMEAAVRVICDHFKPEARKVLLNKAVSTGLRFKCLCWCYAKDGDEKHPRECTCETFESAERARLLHLLKYMNADHVYKENGFVGEAARIHAAREEGKAIPATTFKNGALYSEKAYYSGRGEYSDPVARMKLIKRQVPAYKGPGRRRV